MRLSEYAFGALTAWALFAPGAWAQVDTSSEEGLLELLNEGRETKLSKRDVCIQRPRQLDGLVMIGTFANDRGCRLELAVFGADKMPPADAGKRLLTIRRWHESLPKDRAQLALTWIQHGMLAFETVLLKPDETFVRSKAKFHTPRAIPDGKGGAIVTAWTRAEAGMQPGTTFVRVRYPVDPDGLTGKLVVLERIEVAPEPPAKKAAPK